MSDRNKPHKVIMACKHGVDFRKFCIICDTDHGEEPMGPTIDEVNADLGGGIDLEAAHRELERMRVDAAAKVDEMRGKVPISQGRLPSDANTRKGIPIATGCLDYFPDALAEIAKVSRIGNDKHNPGQPLHWARGKSNDHPDCLIRHFMDRGTMDMSGAEPVRHSAQMAWRALAILQIEIEESRK